MEQPTQFPSYLEHNLGERRNWKEQTMKKIQLYVNFTNNCNHWKKYDNQPNSIQYIKTIKKAAMQKYKTWQSTHLDSICEK